MARTHADPALATPVEDAGSRRPRVVLVLVVGVLLAAVVRGLVVQSYVVPSAALAPTVEPGDRLLVWKAFARPSAGDLVVVDTTGTAAVTAARATPTGNGIVGRALGALADAVGVRMGPQDELAVVSAVRGSRVAVAEPEARDVPVSRVVGVAGFRFWPLGRLGVLDGGPG